MNLSRASLVRWSAVGVVLLAVGAFTGYRWAQRSMSSSNQETTDTKSMQPPSEATREPKGKRRILYWHDPMVPGPKFDKPGKSPFMDMELVPVYADEESGKAGIRISPDARQNFGIRLGKVEKTELGKKLRAIGSVAFDEGLLELVTARAEGYVTRLRVKTPLERVHRGEPLAEILVPQWREAEEEYLVLLDAASARAQALRDAARRRLVVLGVPKSAILALERTRTTDASTTLVSPIDGVITELGVREGAVFPAGATLFRINGLATVWANAQIPEAKVSRVPAGSQVQAYAAAWPGSTFEGKVAALLPQVDPQTRTLTARVAIQNPERKLSPGMFVTLDFPAPEVPPELVIPSEALIATGERSVVIVAREDGGFEVTNVSVGDERAGRTVILSGLTEGQSIVLSGQFLLDSEASLKSAVNRLTNVPSSASAAHDHAAPQEERP